MPRETGKHVAGGTPKEKKPKKPSRLTRQQKILLAVAICLAVALAAVAGYRALFVQPDIPNKPDTDETEQEEEEEWGEGIRPVSGEPEPRCERAERNRLVSHTDPANHENSPKR